MDEEAFSHHQQAALALLNGRYPMSTAAGRFLGQLTVDNSPLTKAQHDWLERLLARAGLPALAEVAE